MMHGIVLEIGWLNFSFRKTDLIISPALPGVSKNAKELIHIKKSVFKGDLSFKAFIKILHLKKRNEIPNKIKVIEIIIVIFKSLFKVNKLIP